MATLLFLKMQSSEIAPYQSLFLSCHFSPIFTESILFLGKLTEVKNRWVHLGENILLKKTRCWWMLFFFFFVLHKNNFKVSCPSVHVSAHPLISLNDNKGKKKEAQRNGSADKHVLKSLDDLSWSLRTTWWADRTGSLKLFSAHRYARSHAPLSNKQKCNEKASK